MGTDLIENPFAEVGASVEEVELMQNRSHVSNIKAYVRILEDLQAL